MKMFSVYVVYIEILNNNYFINLYARKMQICNVLCICISCTFLVPNAPLQDIWYTYNGAPKLLLMAQPWNTPSPTLRPL